MMNTNNSQYGGENPMPTMEEIQQGIFTALSAYEPTADGLETEEEKTEFDAYMSDVLDDLGKQEKDKADAIAYAILHAEAEADFFRRESERFATRCRVIKNRIKSMKERIAYTLREYNLKDVSGSKYKLALRKSQRVMIENEGIIPTSYFRVIPETREPDKKAIGDALKSGKEIIGASLEDSYSVNIR